MESNIVHGMERWFSEGSAHVHLARALAVWPLLVIVAVVILAWLLDWSRAPWRRTALVLGAAAAAIALGGNQLLGHFVYRARPFVALHVHPLIAHGADSSLYSDHLAVAGGLIAGLIASRRTFLSVLSLVLAASLSIGRIGAALHYPSDAAAGALAGATAFILMLPFRTLVARPVGLIARVESRIRPRAAGAIRTPGRRRRPDVSRA